MLDIIVNNPFRLLGVLSNSPQKEIVANQGKMKAFLKVGKTVDFPIDLQGILSPINRTEQKVSEAASQLTLPQEKFKYAQFWFVKANSMDDVALNNLISGDIDKAIGIWEKKDSVSSYQNRLVCYLIKEDLTQAMNMVCSLYEPMDAGAFSLVNINCMELVRTVMGEDSGIKTSELGEQFLSILVEKYGRSSIINSMPECTLKNSLGNDQVREIIEEISKLIDVAKTCEKGNAQANLDAGTQLMNSSKQLLEQLRQLVNVDDMQYQMIADKLGQAILQFGINYYNDAEEPDAAKKAFVLQNYALSIVVGKMAKDRCKENVDIIKKAIENLPPSSVYAEDKAIKDELIKYNKLPDRISHAVALLNNTKPHLLSIKTKLGSDNNYYLKMSTLIVSNALHNIIEEVNSAQSSSTLEIELILNREATLRKIKSVVQAAWNATKIMDSFDMESDFRTNRYSKNRSSLVGLCNQVGVSTSTSSEGCYIATMVYGDYEHPQVMVLRDFRDSYLRSREWGRRFISFYYKNSPNWVEYLRDKKLINIIIRHILDNFIKVYKYGKN